MTEIDFYILSGSTTNDRWAFVARLADKIFRARHHLLIASSNEAHSQELSQHLWTNQPTTFIGHSVVGNAQPINDPVLISHDSLPAHCHDVLINLTDRVLEDHFSRFHRLVEVVVQEEQVLAQSRKAYQFYKSRGYPIRTHDLTGRRLQ